MISYFPAIYPDELVYSWFCRYYVHSGFFSSKSAMQELYCKRSDNPSKEFIGNLNPGAVEQIAKMYPLDKLVLEHAVKPTGIGNIKSETWASARSIGVGLWNPVFRRRVSRALCSARQSTTQAAIRLSLRKILR